jgi:hypothetical protein
VGDIFAARASDPRIFALQYKKIVSKLSLDGRKIELTRDAPIRNQLAGADDDDDDDDDPPVTSLMTEDWSPDLEVGSG